MTMVLSVILVVSHSLAQVFCASELLRSPQAARDVRALGSDLDSLSETYSFSHHGESFTSQLGHKRRHSTVGDVRTTNVHKLDSQLTWASTSTTGTQNSLENGSCAQLSIVPRATEYFTSAAVLIVWMPGSMGWHVTSCLAALPGAPISHVAGKFS